MSVWIVSQEGDILLHCTIPATPAPFLQAVVAARAGLVVAVAGLYTWYWLAARCTPSEAATLCLRNTPQGQKLLSRVEKKHDQGKALRLLAHTLGRAVYSRN
jgi:hypothetical protein